jgi:hypothetical protein
MVLMLCGCGPLLLLSGFWPTRRRRSLDGMSGEYGCWRDLWRPLVPSVVALALLAGWALQEPEACDEPLRWSFFALALPFGVIWARATIRALQALRVRACETAVATVGLWRPRIYLSERFVATVDQHALAAARAHEAAHCRHRDPLRIWLTQWITDLQWPGPTARRRWHDWRRALELARDDEARMQGIEGVDLAAAIVAAARCAGNALATAGLVDDGDALAARVERLLRPLQAEPRGTPRPWWRGFCAVAAIFALFCALGVVYGDHVVRLIAGVAA